MRLYATITSERGSRAVKKGGNEYIKMSLSNKNINVFDIVFKDDRRNRGLLEILDYSNGETKIIEYGE